MTGSAFRQKMIGPQLLAYETVTTQVNITSTDDEVGTEIISADVTCDGETPILITFHGPFPILKADAGQTSVNIGLMLVEDGSTLGFLGQYSRVVADGATVSLNPWTSTARFVPTAGDHTYSIHAYVSSTNNDNSRFFASGVVSDAFGWAEITLRIETDPSPT